MNTIDGNYIGYLLATLHTLDMFSTSKSATSKNVHQARIQAIIANIDINWLKTLKKWGEKKVEIGLNQSLIIICPFPPTLAPIFFWFPPLQLSSQKRTILRHKKYGRVICSLASLLPSQVMPMSGVCVCVCVERDMQRTVCCEADRQKLGWFFSDVIVTK